MDTNPPWGTGQESSWSKENKRYPLPEKLVLPQHGQCSQCPSVCPYLQECRSKDEVKLRYEISDSRLEPLSVEDYVDHPLSHTVYNELFFEGKAVVRKGGGKGSAWWEKQQQLHTLEKAVTFLLKTCSRKPSQRLRWLYPKSETSVFWSLHSETWQSINQETTQWQRNGPQGQQPACHGNGWKRMGEGRDVKSISLKECSFQDNRKYNSW